MKNILYMVRNQLCVILVVVVIFLIIASGNKSEEVITYNVSSINSIQAVHLVSKYNPDIVETIYASNIAEVLQYGETNPVIFNGTMTGYGPDCVGCTGKVSCPPRTDVRNGNIYFNDNEYGTVRIVAADKGIPCGTIIKVNGNRLSSEMIVIVLDRGGVIKGTLMDLLMTSENSSVPFGRQNVVYEVVRWGW
jgi:3D (Asp-Asp-Asp) domain-containing protein